jgi:hypothetical protein
MHKGLQIKADDLCASLCHTCHMRLDQGKDMTKQQRRDLWWRAHVNSLREIVMRGLWPKDVELPDYV